MQFCRTSHVIRFFFWGGGCTVAPGWDHCALSERELSMWAVCCNVCAFKALPPARVMDAPLCSTG